MNHRRTAAQHQSDAVAALISGALTNPHQPGEPTPERARLVLPWLAREIDHAITWEVDTTHSTVATIAGRITESDPQARRQSIEAWAAVIGSWSISDRDGRMSAIGMYQGFPVEITATA